MGMKREGRREREGESECTGQEKGGKKGEERGRLLKEWKGEVGVVSVIQ